MNRGIPCEQDLQSENAVKWANAVMQCQAANPYCGADGYCHADGACFEHKENEPLTLDRAIQMIEKLTQELDEANVKVNQVITNQQKIIARLDREVAQAKKLNKSERLFALQSVKNLIKRVSND